MKKCYFKLFRILRIEYIIHKKTHKIYCKRFENIPFLFSGNIFDYDWVLFGTSSSSITSNELFTSVFSNFICGRLVGASNGTGCSCNRYHTFSIDNDNLQKIEATNCDPTYENHRPNAVYLKCTGRPIQKYTIPYSKLLSNTLSWKNNIPQIKQGNITFAPTSFSRIITLQCYVSTESDLYLQLFKKLLKTATLAK